MAEQDVLQTNQKLRDDLFGADSEGEEEEQYEPEQEAEAYGEPVGQDDQQQGQEGQFQAQEGYGDEEGYRDQPAEQDAEYGTSQPDAGEYYEDQEGYREDEAVEVEDEDEISRMMKAAKTRKKAHEKSFQQISSEVDVFLASMEWAAEQDVEANKLGQPALHKLKMLPQLQAKIAERRLHEVLMDAGILGVLKAWIEPMPGGHLPNSKVRAAVLTVLLQLMVDPTQPNRKEQLKRSGIGRAVLFLNKLPEETPTNRRLAKELVENWSRPIFEQYSDGRREEQHLEQQQRQIQLARLQRKRKQQEAGGDAAAEPQKAKGEESIRFHATVPQPARLDYLEQPESRVMINQREGPTSKSKPDRLSRKLKNLSRKSQAGSGRAAKISLEGRGMMI